NTYTLAGPTLKGVGTTTRWKNRAPAATVPIVSARLCGGAAFALAPGDVGPERFVLPAVRGPVVDRESGRARGVRTGPSLRIGPIAPGKFPHSGSAILQRVFLHEAAAPLRIVLWRC